MTSAVATTLVVATAIATAFAAVTSTATATLTGDDVDKCLNLLLGSIVHAQYLTLEYEVHTCIGVVEVNGNSLVLNLYHKAIHALAFSIYEGDNVACIDLLVVELAIHAENVLVYIEYKVVTTIAIALVLGKGEVEGVALFQVVELSLESLEGEAQTSSKLEGLLSGSLLYKLLNAFKLGIHVV